MIKPNERDAALRYLERWIEENCRDQIKICDPYFSADDVFILRIILAKAPQSQVSVLTCAKAGITQAEFQQAWQELSDQSPPDTYVMAVSTDSGKQPIHDRWIVTKQGGLRIGTSFNSLGNKLSEMSMMREHERAACEEELDKYFARQITIDGRRVRCVTFDLA